MGKVRWVGAQTIDIGEIPFDVPPSASVTIKTPYGDQPMKLGDILPGALAAVSYSEQREDVRIAKAVRVLSLPTMTAPPQPTPIVRPSASPATLQSPLRVFIQTGDTHFVTAVNGGGGASVPTCGPGTIALDTSAVTAGPWQKFSLISLGDQQYALRTAGGGYVSAVSSPSTVTANADQKSRLHIDATKADTDEFFTLVPAGSDIAIQTADGAHYVTAVAGGGCAGSDSLPFRTNAETIGETEKFWIVPLSGQKGEL